MSGPARSTRGSVGGYHAGIAWDAQPLGQMPDNALARRLGVNVGSVYEARVRRGIARFDRSIAARMGFAHRLGVETDRAIADDFGISPNTVAHARKRAGIDPVGGAWRDWDGVPLGRYYDREIAEALGCTPTSVSDARRVRGIPAYRERRACGCGRAFMAYTRNQIGCSRLCSGVAVNHRQEGRPEATLALSQALAALRRELKRRNV